MQRAIVLVAAGYLVVRGWRPSHDRAPPLSSRADPTAIALLGFRVQGSEFRVQVSGYRVQGFGSSGHPPSSSDEPTATAL